MSGHSQPIVMAIDVGSGSCRALLFDRKGRMLGLSQQEWAYHPVADAPGGLDFDPVDGWNRIAHCVRDALARSEVSAAEVAAVTATSMREGFVLYDAAGEEIWACPNVDARATREAEELIQEGLADKQYRRGGDWTSITAPPRIRWLQRRRPELWERVAYLNMLGDWVLKRLSGKFCTDPSLGSSSNLFDLAETTWSPATAAELGLGEILPPVLAPGSVMGEVTTAAAKDTGLTTGTPVVVAGADTQLALLGAGLTGSGQFATVGGTFWQTAAVIDQPLVDPQTRLRTLCHVLPGTWMIEGIGFMHGLSTRWVRDGFLRSANPQFPVDRGYERLEELASAVPPAANGLFYLCSNVMEARHWKHGPSTLLGFNVEQPEVTGLGAIYRAVEEEAAYVSRAHYDILAEVCGQGPKGIRFVGGASRGRLWSQILADVVGVPVEIPSVAEATCLGAAICALVGVGAYRGLADAAAEIVTIGRVHEPDPERHRIYQEAFERRQGLYAHMLKAADQGIVPHFWRGAGA